MDHCLFSFKILDRNTMGLVYHWLYDGFIDRYGESRKASKSHFWKCHQQHIFVKYYGLLIQATFSDSHFFFLLWICSRNSQVAQNWNDKDNCEINYDSSDEMISALSWLAFLVGKSQKYMDMGQSTGMDGNHFVHYVHV